MLRPGLGEIEGQDGIRLVRIQGATSTDLERRKKVFSRLGELYQTRSGIVHTGEHDVSEEDLADARRYCKIALLTLLRAGASEVEMRIQDFPNWAREQLLAT